MGQEITDSEFDAAAFARFRKRLDDETELLGDWLRTGRLEEGQRRFGFELEGWLVDASGHPAPRNQDFLAAIDDAGAITHRYCEAEMTLDFSDLVFVERELNPGCHLAGALGATRLDEVTD